MRYKAYFLNIDQDFYPRPLKFIAESEDFEKLLLRIQKEYPNIFYNWVEFYDTKHNLRMWAYKTKNGFGLQTEKVNPKHEHDYNPSKFTKTELAERLAIDLSKCIESSEKCLKYYKEKYTGIFAEWMLLNQVINSNNRFDKLRKGFPKCKGLTDVKLLLLKEGYAELYPKLPKWLINNG